ncbi:MAG: glutamine amidotransferase [Bacteroidetes bacterium]|nr:glutamine amidotransferase [Bacteroidota bacterium]
MRNKILTLAVITTMSLGCNEQKKNEDKEQLTAKQQASIADSLASCSPNTTLSNSTSYQLYKDEITSLTKNVKKLDPNLPTIGILMYDKVLMTELTAPMDVFAKHSEDGKQLFNVITIAENYDLFISEEGLKMFPDYTFSNAPKLDIIIVPSAYDMAGQVKNQKLIAFIRMQNENTDFTVSNCGGASLIGETGIADGKKIVTWIGGGIELQKSYPNLKVQDDSKISFVEDGKFMSSNGNLASYISSLELLEKLTSKKHRKFVESYLYLDRLQQWKK